MCCMDCKFGNGPNDYREDADRKMTCHFYPEQTATTEKNWCGQFIPRSPQLVLNLRYVRDELIKTRREFEHERQRRLHLEKKLKSLRKAQPK